MIKVTVELWPFGQEDRKKVIAEAFIANDGTGNPDRGNYVAWIRQKTNRSLKFGRVKDYRRKTESVWVLISKVIESAMNGYETPTTKYEELLKEDFMKCR